MSGYKSFDLVDRGTYGSDTVGNILFVVLRSSDSLIQRALLLNSPIPRLATALGLRTPRLPILGGPPLRSTGLSPYQTFIWTMAWGSAVKQIFWKFAIAREHVYPKGALTIAFFNTFLNSTNTLLYLMSGENPTFVPPWTLYAGTIMYVVGILTETISEIQRERFKKNPRNKGKIFTGGLFSFARHVHYFGYSMWRAGFAMAAGGPIWSLMVGGFFLRDFAVRAVPVLDRYMAKRYGEQWSTVKREVPYALIPGVW